MYCKILTTTLFAATATISQAVTANPNPFDYKQPDGTTVKLIAVGDEFAHLYMTTDSIVVDFDNDGYVQWGNKVDRAHLNTQLMQMRKKSHRLVQRNKSLSEIRSSEQIPDNIEGKIRGLIVMVNFKNLTFKDTQQRISQLMNAEGYSENGATGSAHDYFIAQSSGKFTPTFDVVGPVTLDQNSSYYARYDMANVDEMIFNSVDLAVEQGLLENLDAYDRDNDGTVDMVYILYAGLGAADGGNSQINVWPHMSNLKYSYAFRDRTIAGKKLGLYACSAEYNGRYEFSGIGTFCHEYGHCLGLPDMYDVDYSGGYGMASFSIMGSGSYNNDGKTPPNYNGFERYSLGWMQYTNLSSPQDVALEEIGSSNTAYRIPSENPNEYFTLENRQYVGWDYYLASHGLMILHIDYDQQAWEQNSVNDNPYHQHVRLMAADNDWSSRSLGGDLYPGSLKNTEFTDESRPASTLWDGSQLGKPITDIAQNDGLITFKFMGGDDTNQGSVANVDNGSMTVSCIAGGIHISTKHSEVIRIYNASGMLIESLYVDEGSHTVSLAPGLYIVTSPTARLKAIVR